MKELDEKITAVPKWDKSAKQIWEERFEALEDDSPAADKGGKVVGIRSRAMLIVSIAASLLFVISATALFYTKDFSAEMGQNRIVHLPDGSLAELASGTDMSYRPLIWFMAPKVEMEGEAYFSGKHKEGFTVRTEQGNVKVIGTSFNVRTYDNSLVVSCIDGKVVVKGMTSDAVTLTKDMQTTISSGGVTTGFITDRECVVGWTKGVFSFTDKPLSDVLKDVERYFDVKVAAPDGIDTLRYTGRFTRDKSPQEVLDIIGQPYGITLQLVK